MTTGTSVEARERTRDEIPEAYTWNLSDIYPSWAGWEEGLAEFERMLPGYAELRGHACTGTRSPVEGLSSWRRPRAAVRTRIWYYAGLTYDQDQRDNQTNARRQQVQILFAKAAEAASWFDPGAAAAFRSTPFRAGWQDERRTGGLPLRDREALPPAGTCARRKGRAPAVALEPLLVDARTTRTRCCPPPT